MPYVPEWVADCLGDRNFLEVALDVRMTASGARERSFETGEADQNNDINILRWKLDNWIESSLRYQKFDNLVKSLIEAALEEVEWEYARQSKMQV